MVNGRPGPASGSSSSPEPVSFQQWVAITLSIMTVLWEGWLVVLANHLNAQNHGRAFTEMVSTPQVAAQSFAGGVIALAYAATIGLHPSGRRYIWALTVALYQVFLIGGIEVQEGRLGTYKVDAVVVLAVVIQALIVVLPLAWFHWRPAKKCSPSGRASLQG